MTEGRGQDRTNSLHQVPFFLFFFFFWWPHAYKTVTLLSILLWLFWRWSLEKYLPWLATHCDPPDLSLLSN
jgi:hypothetical protein